MPINAEDQNPYLFLGLCVVGMLVLYTLLISPISCSSEASNLATGSQAVVAGESGASIGDQGPSGELVSSAFLSPGVVVRVGHDPGYQRGRDSRLVKVTVETGRHAGESGSVRREDLRPIR